MENTDGINCGLCGFTSRAGAKFCGSCGNPLPNGILCRDCGLILQQNHKFCYNCGATASAPATRSPTNYKAVVRDTFQPYIPRFAIPKRLRPLQAWVSRTIGRVSIPLMVSGALLVAFQQIRFAMSYETNEAASGAGLSYLALGLVLFTLGAFGRRAGDGTLDALERVSIPSLRIVAGEITWIKLSALGLGCVVTCVLALRLLAGSQSGWDLLIWLLAVCACGAPFVGRLKLSPASLAIPRERYVDILIVLSLAGIFIAVNTHDLTNWYYSAIGDEYSHYEFAKEMAQYGLQRPFDLDGVHSDINPVMSSIYPALVMRFLGTDNFAWKFSLIISIAAAIPGVYILGYVLAGRTAAFVSSVILAFSHYIFAFMHTGYPNTDVIPIIVWATVLFVLGVRRSSLFLIYASGVLAGLGLFFNIVARAAGIIILLYALLHSDIRRHLVNLLPWALSVLLAAIPLFIVNGGEVFSTALVKIVSTSSQHASEYESAVGRIFANTSQNLTAFNYSSHVSHYVSGALLDPISAALATLGLGYCLANLRKASCRLLLIIFAVLALGTALLSPYPNVPITRMTSLLVPLSLMAGMVTAHFLNGGIVPGLRAAAADGLPRRVWMTSIALVFAVLVLTLNAWQFWIATPKVYHHTQEAVSIGALHLDLCEGATDKVMMVGRATAPLLRPALRSYYANEAMPHLIDHAELEAGYQLPVEAPRCIIFLNPKAEEIQPFMQELSNRYPNGGFSIFTNSSGKNSVEIFVPNAS